MTDYQYPSNSLKSRAEAESKEQPKKQFEKVVDGKKRKKSGLTKIADVFIAENVSNVKEYILKDVIVPAIKKAIYDALVGGVDMFFNGGRGQSSRTTARSATYVSYDRFSSRREEPRTTSTRRIGYEDVVLKTRVDAEKVLRQLDGAMETYKMVTIADLYDLVGEDTTPQDYNYGWTNIRNADIVPVHGGYLLKMPKPCPLD